VPPWRLVTALDMIRGQAPNCREGYNQSSWKGTGGYCSGASRGATEGLITWPPWNASTKAPRQGLLSIRISCHLPLHLSRCDGLHIEVALASANTKTVACSRYTMCYRLLRGVPTKKSCEWLERLPLALADGVSRQQERNKKYVGISCAHFSALQFGFRPDII
jgi:hypothetical protein